MPTRNNTRQLRNRRRHVETRARPLAAQIQRWLVSYARLIVTDEIRNAGLATKATGDEILQRRIKELEALITRFGVRQATNAAAGAVGAGVPILDSQVMRDFFQGKETLVQGLADDTREAIRAGIQQTIQDSLREIPRPSTGTIAQRIRERFVSGDDADLAFAVSPERAALIARTELVQAENSGIVAGYEEMGVEELEWLAYTDGLSGDRHHERMNHVTTPIGTPFVTPLGNELRFPGDPFGPIKDTANCRCTVVAVRR